MIFHSFPGSAINADIKVPGDKSISHRALILSAIADRSSDIQNILLSDDVLSTLNALRALGVDIHYNETNHTAFVMGVGMHGLTASRTALSCGNSGTSMRLLTGLLAAQSFNSVLTGDDSLTKRPMLRVAEPLRLMGAKIELSAKNTAPIYIQGNPFLKAIQYASPIPSAQVKSAILLAGLYAQGKTIVYENTPTRDHTEKMLQHKDAVLKIPGDISSAAFFIVLATITPGSDLMIREVGINPLRTGIIDILKRMGANIEIENPQFFGLEPVADIRIQYALLRGIEIPADLVVKAIDEFPVIFVAAVIASGNTILRNGAELRVKESDRISAMARGLSQLGVRVTELDEGIFIEGGQEFSGGRVDSCGDHRVAMAFAIAGQVAKGPVLIDNCHVVKTSFPNFIELANHIGMICRQSP